MPAAVFSVPFFLVLCSWLSVALCDLKHRPHFQTENNVVKRDTEPSSSSYTSYGSPIAHPPAPAPVPVSPFYPPVQTPAPAYSPPPDLAPTAAPAPAEEAPEGGPYPATETPTSYGMEMKEEMMEAAMEEKKKGKTKDDEPYICEAQHLIAPLIVLISLILGLFCVLNFPILARAVLSPIVAPLLALITFFLGLVPTVVFGQGARAMAFFPEFRDANQLLDVGLAVLEEEGCLARAICELGRRLQESPLLVSFITIILPRAYQAYSSILEDAMNGNLECGNFTCPPFDQDNQFSNLVSADDFLSI